LLFHLRWVAALAEVADAEHAKHASIRVVAERTGAQAEAARRQALAAAAMPALRASEAQAAAVLQRLNSARETLEREEARAKDRIRELDLRLVQLADDLQREQVLAADAAAALDRIGADEAALGGESAASAERAAAAAQRTA